MSPSAALIDDSLAARKARMEPRRFLADPAPSSAFSPLDSRRIVVQDRPEADPLIRFLAYFETSPNGVQGLGSTMTAAEEDLEMMEAECMGERAGRAEHGESHWWEAA